MTRRRGRPTVEIELSADERRTLERWARRHSSSQALALRSKIVLACADPDLSRPEIAERVGCNPATVTKWRHRFAADRLDGLVDAPRPGADRKVGDDMVEAVIVDTLETTPLDGTHWSTRSLAIRHGLSHRTIGEIWRAFGLKPWRQDDFKVSPDPDLIEKIRDVVGLYLNPPVAAVVFAVDEKPQIQALNRTAPTLPMLPTTPARATHDYERNGTVDLFAALNIGSGEVITNIEKRHRAIEFRKFLNQIDKTVPDGLDVHLIVDNLSTHKTPAIERWLKAHPRFELHFTPTSSSWLNLVERWFSELTTKLLRRSAHANTRELSNDIVAWAEAWNDNPRPYIWHKTADEILESIKRVCERITNSGH